jgi:hypothetical protein
MRNTLWAASKDGEAFDPDAALGAATAGTKRRLPATSMVNRTILA